MTQGPTKGIPIDTDGTLAANSDVLVASQKAVKTYADTKQSALSFPLSPGSGGTGVNNGTNLLTIPATGTAALGTGTNTRVALWSGTNTLSSDAAFTFASNVMSVNVSSAAAIVGATLANPNATAGSSARLSISADSAAAIFQAFSAATGGGARVNLTVSGGYILFGTTDANPVVFYASNAEVFRIAVGGALTQTAVDAATNTVTTLLTSIHNSSGTPASGYGSSYLFSLKSSTTDSQSAASIDVAWVTATHASRAASMKFYAYDTSARNFLTGSTDGSNPTIGLEQPIITILRMY
jgi:hypothetical protein